MFENEFDAVPIPLPEIGELVRVIANTNNHNYRIGSVYRVVSHAEHGGTLRARDLKTGKDGNHVQACDLRPAAAIDWFWLKERLPPDDVALLEAFDGLMELTLKPEARYFVMQRLPDLEAAIRRVIR